MVCQCIDYRLKHRIMDNCTVMSRKIYFVHISKGSLDHFKKKSVVYVCIGITSALDVLAMRSPM
jgi:hypothetical protein